MKKNIKLTLIAVLLFGCRDKEFFEPYAKSDGGNPKDINFNRDLDYGVVKDIDGIYYKTITIGSQTWMAENLRVTRFRNGDVIPIVTDNYIWTKQNSAACSYYDNVSQNGKEYGMIYNAFVVSDPRNICPEGWHIPSLQEWKLLAAASGTVDLVGPLMEAGTKHWNDPNDLATNSTGFTAVPAGARNGSGDGSFHDISMAAFFWNTSSDQYSSGACRLSNYKKLLEVLTVPKSMGMAIRCIKD